MKIFNLILSLLFIIGSCEPINEHIAAEELGYPSTIEFTAEGGEYIYEGNNVGTMCVITVLDAEENAFKYEFDEDTQNYRYKNDWLSIEANPEHPQITIKAQPNSSNQLRQCKFEVNKGYYYSTITVNQSAN